MVKDAEAHAEEDRKARELADARNQADAMVHNVRRTMKEAGDKLADSDKESIEAAIKEVEEATRTDDKDEIQKKTEALMQASHKLAEQMYKATQEAGAAAGGEQGGGEAPSGEKDNVVDAEFEEVKENKGKK